MDFTINVDNNDNKIKKSKGFNDIQKISNAQTVNPVFNFSWDSQKPAGSKVFARKKPDRMKPSIPTITKPQVVSPKIDIASTKKNFVEKPPVDRIDKQPDNNESIDNTNESENLDVLKKGHIKRKQKKSKLLATKLAKEGRQHEIKLPQNDQKNYSLFNEIHKKIFVDTHAGKSVSEKVFIGGFFKELEISTHLISNLEKINFSKLTNVQGKSIPVVMSGKNTLIRSQTGSGKTLAYVVPIIDALQGITPRIKRTDGVQAIIVVPTRELALQTHELFGKINTFQWINVGYLCGGENRKSEKNRIRKGINVLIATPGRLLDHVLHTEALKVDQVRCLVLDEADRLLDMGFRKDIITLVEELDKVKANSDYNPMAILKKSKKTFDSDEEEDVAEPKEILDEIAPLKDTNSKLRQTILLSATLTKGVSELAEFTMKTHTYIDALDQTSNVMLDSFVIPDTVKQEFIMTYVKHRLFTLSALLVAKAKQNAKIFVFMASGQMVEYHHQLFSQYLARMPVNRGKKKFGKVAILEDDDVDSEDSDDEEVLVLDIQFFKLHGSMDQRERKDVFTSFRAAKKGILICTDVACRGIDVPMADCIIQYTGPQTDEDYLHRVGRTGRAGNKGEALIFLTHEEQDYITHLREHRVFLTKKDPEEYLKYLCEFMEETNTEQAATTLQNRYVNAVAKNKELYRAACFAYSTWSRFYNSYPTKMRTIFDFKKVNLGHYVTSFALRDTPTGVAKVVRGQVSNVEAPRLNRKLANHQDQNDKQRARPPKENRKKPSSSSIRMSEFASGLEPPKKKKKKKEIEED